MAEHPCAVVAIGGNALGGGRGPRSLAAQWDAARRTGEHLAALVVAEGCRLVVTHGNGPQVGDVLRRSEMAAPEVPPLTMDLAVAQTQGSIGYALAEALRQGLEDRGDERPVAALVTETVVAVDDPAFRDPTKPVGPFLTEAEALDRRRRLGWHVRAFGERGWRRVVPSPRPLAVVQIEAIRRLLAAGAVVVAAGGGGIPVVRRRTGLHGVDAVIDKDLVSSLLARELGAAALLVATDVEGVTLHHGTARETPLSRVTVAEARRYLEAGEFPPGSMGPKVEAILAFLEAGGARAAVSSIACLTDAWRGSAGTQFSNPSPGAPES